jgi:type IV pilus assembly protein PilO
MTNLQQGAPPRSLLLRNGVLIGLPVAAGVLVAGLVALGGVFQPWDQLRRNQLQLDELRGMNERLPLLRAQRVRQLDQVKTVDGQRSSLLKLIAGSGQISTFLAQLNREASAAGVQLDVFEPVVPKPAAAPPPAGGNEKEPPPPPDPLEADGLKRTTLLLSARGRYPNLLVFLRRLERLSLLVAQSDLNLDLEAIRAQAQPAANRPAAQAPPIPQVVLKLNLALYSEGPAIKPSGKPAKTAVAPAPAGTPPATSPAAPAPPPAPQPKPTAPPAPPL